SPTVEKLPAFLHAHLKRFHGRLKLLAVGSRGVWTITKRREVKRALAGLATDVVVMSDVEAAFLSIFGRARPGLMVISGTGSIGYGRSKKISARAGGLGPLKGDEGSAFWIGRKWLKRHNAKEAGSVRRIALKTHLVIRK